MQRPYHLSSATNYCCLAGGGGISAASTKPGASSSSSFVNVTTSGSATSHPGDLEELQSVLHFPEEVALRLTDAEYQLFYQVSHGLPFISAAG